jgi:hypothetical protein
LLRLDRSPAPGPSGPDDRGHIESPIGLLEPGARQSPPLGAAAVGGSWEGPVAESLCRQARSFRNQTIKPIYLGQLVQVVSQVLPQLSLVARNNSATTRGGFDEPQVQVHRRCRSRRPITASSEAGTRRPAGDWRQPAAPIDPEANLVPVEQDQVLHVGAGPPKQRRSLCWACSTFNLSLTRESSQSGDWPSVFS